FGSPTFKVADVDGNRSPDIVFEQHQSYSVTPYYFFNDGTGNFVRDVPKLGTQYLGSLSKPVDLNRDGVMDQVGTACHSWGQEGCLETRWYKRISQALPNP
ncbi:FG-GAP repeat domain-containing protein, partial [Pseudomonadota bacterium]